MLRCVLFAPEDIAVVKGDPDQRRRYLDDLLVAMRPRYAGVRADYERVLRQRTALLKSAKARGAVPPGALEVWDDHLVTAGVAAHRGAAPAGRASSAAWSPPATARCRAPSGTPACGTGCRLPRRSAPSTRTAAAARRGHGPPGVPGRRRSGGHGAGPRAGSGKLALTLREALAARRRAELERAVCLVGPHRDELELRHRRAARPRLRQPWRVVVAGAGASAGRLPAAARGRRGSGAHAGRRVRRAGQRPPATGWPSWWPTPSRSWSPRRCPRMCRPAWRAPGSGLRTG